MCPRFPSANTHRRARSVAVRGRVTPSGRYTAASVRSTWQSPAPGQAGGAAQFGSKARCKIRCTRKSNSCIKKGLGQVVVRAKAQPQQAVSVSVQSRRGTARTSALSCSWRNRVKPHVAVRQVDVQDHQLQRRSRGKTVPGLGTWQRCGCRVYPAVRRLSLTSTSRSRLSSC